MQATAGANEELKAALKEQEENAKREVKETSAFLENAKVAPHNQASTLGSINISFWHVQHTQNYVYNMEAFHYDNAFFAWQESLAKAQLRHDNKIAEEKKNASLAAEKARVEAEAAARTAQAELQALQVSQAEPAVTLKRLHIFNFATFCFIFAL